ncbi:MAG: glycosyltransferase family 2 protein [Flavobacteriaceae bacterium]|nr:glycosyltransferase family 2 protein [Flavobacteriaceae bacterium]
MLAIIIPYYKLIFFEETLQSLSNQTDKRFKIYIGDDASPENPSVLLEKYKGKFEFTYQRFEENLGSASLTKQWVRCIALSNNEEWIMVLGDDDVLGENVVEEFYKQLTIFKEKSNVVRFASEVINGNNEIISKKFEHPVWETATDSYYRKYIGKTRSSLSEHIFLKVAFLKYKFCNYPLGWHSDDRAWIEFSENQPIYTINESVVFIRVSDESISGKTDNEQLKRQATISFFKNIITKKLGLFNADQQYKLLLDFEIFMKKNGGLSLKEWRLMIYSYIKLYKFIPIVKVIRRFFISLFVKNNV